MDFNFADEQLAFRDAIRKFLMVEAPPEWLREIWETTESGRSNEMRGKLAEQGLTAMSVPEKFDGLGMSDLDWVLVQQELGYFAIPDSLLDTAYVGAYLLNGLADDHPVKTEWLPKVASGEARIAVGHPINPMVADAKNAGLLLLWHNDEVHAVKPADVQLSLNSSIDLSRRLFHVTWTPSEATRVCDAASGKALWAGAIDRASLAISAQLIGLAQRMLDLGVDYAAQRKQFGKPIGSFQAIKHHMANIAVKIEFATPVLHRAAYALAENAATASVHVSHARLAAGEAALLAARNSIQTHGGIGYTWESDLQMFMKRAWALNAAWGDRIFHKSRVEKALLSAAFELGPTASFV
ncbi:acyl-CoA dehydrogenase family protein [Sinimarinibacterium sp. NLF-5-8]|uniref:acyl-CoA dehydrogenase family protein n=1 Tax=Sinimarinibacterium sp. NLF-5-8 TaxID=2698684 RepID=UPI00137C2984|nr:acyl-CoA dehydrogenase family protein [Sinimarinibacterium sp. NLF-5-8]QHS10163.1 acyl-CoA/acyl-ACP dehydrogenase [Sinimarinibacterium sp. NLF-5-8]